MANQREKTVDKFRRLSRFWEKRAKRQRKAIEDALIAFSVDDLDGVERILTNALSKVYELTDPENQNR